MNCSGISVNMRVYLALYLWIFTVHGFLLEPDHTSRPGSNNKCLTFESFVAEKKALEREIEQKRLESDQTISVLTSQLQKKFSGLEQKIEKIDHDNGTSIWFENMEMMYRELAYNYTITEGKLRDVINENRLKDSEIAILRNATVKLEKELSDLRNAKAIQNLVDLQSFQQQMNIMQKQITLLTSNQNARDQDFLAFHNLTMNSDTKMMSQLQSLDSKILNKLRGYDSKINQLKNVDSNTMNQLQIIERNQNLSSIAINSEIVALQKQVSNNSRKVALTACSSDRKTFGGPVVFDEIETSTGINNIESFRTTGIFNVTTSGLYFISAYLHTNSNGYDFRLRRNGKNIAYAATTQSTGWGTTSIVSVTEANKNDEIYLVAPNVYIGNVYSCLSVFKVK